MEVAEIIPCSLATAKRRIARAEQQFLTTAAQYPDYPALLGLTNDEKETE